LPWSCFLLSAMFISPFNFVLLHVYHPLCIKSIYPLSNARLITVFSIWCQADCLTSHYYRSILDTFCSILIRAHAMELRGQMKLLFLLIYIPLFRFKIANVLYC